MAKPDGTFDHEPTETTRKLISEFSAFGITQERMAARLGICVDTLVKHYRSEIDNGKTNAVHEIANKLYNKAVDQDDLSAQIFYLKTQGGWSDKTKEALNAAQSVLEQFAAFTAANAQKK